MKMHNRILVNLIPGLLPIFIFVIADEIWGMDTALFIAVVFSVGELFFTWYRTGRFETFILLDVSLIVALGVVSLIMNNDIFFKLKPALIELILVMIIGFSSYGKKNIMLEMSKRYLRDVRISKAAEYKMNMTMRVLFWLILAHAGLVVWSALSMSQEAWAFISGILFYLLILGYFLFELVRNYLRRRKFGKTEMVPVVDEEGQVTGMAPRDKVHFNKDIKLLHPVVHLHLFNHQGQIFLQYRPPFKKVQPDKWDTAVGGHVSYGETIEEALHREVSEEIGLSDYKPLFLAKYVWETEVEKELVYMFMAVTDETPVINPDELGGGRFWSAGEINENRKADGFTPNFLHEFDMMQRNKVIR